MNLLFWSEWLFKISRIDEKQEFYFQHFLLADLKSFLYIFNKRVISATMGKIAIVHVCV